MEFLTTQSWRFTHHAALPGYNLDVNAVTQFLLVVALTVLFVLMVLQMRSLVRLRLMLTDDLERIHGQFNAWQLATKRGVTTHCESAAAPAPSTRRPFAIHIAPAPEQPVAVERVGFADAMHLAADGAPASEIASRCGLPIGEARVLVSLQRARAQCRQPH